MAGAGNAQISGPARAIVADCECCADGVGRDYVFARTGIAKLLGGPRGGIFVVGGWRIDAGDLARAIWLGVADVCGGGRSFGVAGIGGGIVGFPKSVREKPQWPQRHRVHRAKDKTKRN